MTQPTTQVSTFSRLALKWFSGPATLVQHPSGDLRQRLEQADANLEPAVFMARWMLRTNIGVFIAIAGIAMAVFTHDAGNPVKTLVLIASSLALLGVFAAWDHLMLSNTISERKSDIDKNMPAAVLFITALSHARIAPRQIFREIGTRKTFGAINRECQRIFAETAYMNTPLRDVLRSAAHRSPSPKWRSFLEGAYGTLDHGMPLDRYLTRYSGDVAELSRIESKRRLNAIELLSEGYVIGALLAPPLFCVIVFVGSLTNPAVPIVDILKLMAFIAGPAIFAVFLFLFRNPDGGA